MILGRDILSEIKIDLHFCNNKIRVNGGTYKGCTAPMKDFSRINFDMSSDWLKYKIFWNEELWERKHFLEAIRRTCRILDSHCEKYNLCKVLS